MYIIPSVPKMLSSQAFTVTVWTFRFSHVVFSTLTFENSLKMHTGCVQWLMPVIPALGGLSDAGWSETQLHFRKEKKAQNVKNVYQNATCFDSKCLLHTKNDGFLDSLGLLMLNSFK